jgi:sugar transferase (PEP-CTERM/EpsH1 system associated)
MARILFLVHRLPYPPNKGDKVRSYHLLRHLSAQHEVHLGTFIDDPDDEVHRAKVDGLCAQAYVGRLDANYARWRSLLGFVRGEPLTLPYHADAALRRWIRESMSRESFDAVIAFSSAMVQFVPEGLPFLVDFVDVDSAKWTQYASQRRWPLSWLYRREGRKLLEYERSVARRASASFFVTEKEVALFESLAPDCVGLSTAVGNGVDADYFAPDPARPSPFLESEVPVVFTGAMDYWPNVDAVRWFAQAMLPRLQQSWPRLRFHVVGRNPTPAVRALTAQGVNVTGAVPDVRPFLQHAAVVVAPLRLARGVQNKVLEAMAMERPVVSAAACVEAIDAVDGRDVLPATSADDYVEAVSGLLQDPQRAIAISRAARRCVMNGYSWTTRLRGLDRRLIDVLSG